MNADDADRELGAAKPSILAQRAPRWRRHRRAIFKHAIINSFLIVILMPLAWVFMMSIKSFPDAMRGDFWPQRFDFSHYSYVFHKIHSLPANLFNSVYVAAGTVALTTACAVLAGFALVYMNIRGGAYFVAGLVVSLYVPVRVVSLVSIYEVQSALGLINSTTGLILPYVTISLSISVLIMRSVFKHVPRELIDAARIDGAGAFRTLWSIALPLARNGVVVVIIVNFVAVWGEFLLCSTLINDQSARTMPVVLAAAQGGVGQWTWPNLAAVYAIVAAPGVLAVIFVQRAFFKGLTEGAVG